jgi:NAD-dependent dihydropyrimidine dehydrogenase PreA subunit
VTYVIAEPCIDVKDRSCLEECPVNCIYEGPDQFYIHPDECIECGGCDRVCPVIAIFPEEMLPARWSSYTDKNAAFFGVTRMRRLGRASGG